MLQPLKSRIHADCRQNEKENSDAFPITEEEAENQAHFAPPPMAKTATATSASAIMPANTETPAMIGVSGRLIARAGAERRRERGNLRSLHRAQHWPRR